MDQLAMPYRIALVAIVVLAGAWFTVLKPSDESDTAPLPAAPGVTGLATARDQAQAAVGASTAAVPATADPAATSAAPATPAAPATAPVSGTAGAAAATSASVGATDPSARLLAAVGAGKVVVLSFLSPRAADDRDVRRAVARVDRRGGRVVVRVADIADVARYEAITRGVQVLQSPTTLVIGRDRTARAVTGVTDSAELDQLVGDTIAGR